MNGRRVAIAGLAALVLLFLSPIVAAEAGDQRFRAGLLYAVPTDDLIDSGQTTELDEALGFQASYEYLIADRIGLEPGIGLLTHDITISESGLPDLGGEVGLLALTVNVNFHIMEGEAADFYIGPTVGYALWDDVELDFTATDFATDDDFLYGANLGVDVPIGKGKWAFNAALTYLFSEVSVDGGNDIGVDPVHLKAGFSYRF